LQTPEGYPLIPGKQKWSFKISALKKIKIHPESLRTMTFVTSLPKIKSQVSFTFKDEKEAQVILAEIKRLFFLQTNTEMEVEQQDKMKRLSRFSFRKFYNN